jgi:hypothetical protein
MYRSFATSFMLLTILLHASFGCGWHHPHAHNRHSQQDVASTGGCSHHHRHDEGSEGSDDPQPVPCDQQDCEFLVAAAKVFAADTCCGPTSVAVVDLHAQRPALVRQSTLTPGRAPSGRPLKLRAQCWLQVWQV